jgi:hypothetical protein
MNTAIADVLGTLADSLGGAFNALIGLLPLAALLTVLVVGNEARQNPQHWAAIVNANRANTGGCITAGCVLFDMVEAKNQNLKATIDALK